MGLDELAEDLGCVRRTVYRDLDALMFAGFPVVSEKRDSRVFYRFLDSFRLGDIPFTADEVLALAFGEDHLRALEGTVFHDSIRQALAKIRAGLRPELAEFLSKLGGSFRVMPGPHKRYARSREVIRTINDAVIAGRGVTMRYRTARTGEVADRAFDPYRIWYRNGGLYAIGHDHRSGEIRTFAIDRIERVALEERTFSVPEDFDFDAYTEASFGVMSEPPVRVRIRFEKEWAVHVEERVWHPSQQLEVLSDGRVELAMEVGGSLELRNWVLSFGAGAEVLEPKTLREEVAAELERAVSHYRPSPLRAGIPASTRQTGARP